jgi:uncharacterized protein (UPF0264 family)
MNFIRKHIELKIISDCKKILKKYDSYMLVLNKPIDAGYEGNWRIVGINNLGLPSMIREISIDWSLISTKELMKMFNQLKLEEYTIQKYRTLYP